MPLPTLDDFKNHLNKTDSENDVELSDILAAARDVVEGVVGPLSSKTLTETHYGISSPLLVLRHSPVSAVAGLETRLHSGSVAFTTQPGDVRLDQELGVLSLVGGYRFQGDVTVTYVAGFDTVPQAVWLATLIIGKHLWETQRGSQPLPLQAQDATDTGTDVAYYSPGIPERARLLLEPFARGSQVA